MVFQEALKLPWKNQGFLGSPKASQGGLRLPRKPKGFHVKFKASPGPRTYSDPQPNLDITWKSSINAREFLGDLGNSQEFRYSANSKKKSPNFWTIPGISGDLKIKNKRIPKIFGALLDSTRIRRNSQVFWGSQGIPKISRNCLNILGDS
jgi:hypothetical protein